MRIPSRSVALVAAIVAAACNPESNTPTPVGELVTAPDPDMVDLGTIDYTMAVLPRASFKFSNGSSVKMFIAADFSAAEPAEVGSLLVTEFEPFTEVLPEQTRPIDVSIDPRTWRWQTGTYDVYVPLEISYFFQATSGILDVTTPLQRISDQTVGDNRMRVVFTLDCDLDDDGFDAFECGGQDCDDFNASINPDAPEDCDTVGIDDDCDGATNDPDAINPSTYYTDADGDGYGVGDPVLSCRQPFVGTWAPVDGDCDDSSAFATPANSIELQCNDQLDNDCNGFTDGADPACGG